MFYEICVFHSFAEYQKMKKKSNKNINLKNQRFYSNCVKLVHKQLKDTAETLSTIFKNTWKRLPIVFCFCFFLQKLCNFKTVCLCQNMKLVYLCLIGLSSCKSFNLECLPKFCNQDRWQTLHRHGARCGLLLFTSHAILIPP